jgi:predicted phage-related endonuclease
MKILNVAQGSEAWHQARAVHFCASDAPAMMGASDTMTRAQLLKEKATGIRGEIAPYVEDVIFVRGHAAEAAIRPYIASVLSDELFPVVGQEGRLLASLDGITMDGETVFEHKLWNEGLATQIEVGELSPHSYWQLEHQLLVSGAKRVIFVCSDGTPEKCVHMFYEPVPGRAATLQTGWNQFDADLKNYAAPAPDPVVEKKSLMALPALSVQIVGQVTTSNLPAYRNSALEFIKAINTDLQNDQDFADAETTVKFCEVAEKNIQDVKAQAIAQTATIDELFRSLDQIGSAMREKRLMLERLVKTRKEQIRVDIVQVGRNNWNAHVNELNRGLARVAVTIPAPDFVAAVKGKRTLSGLRDGVDSVLTTAKIAATQQAELFGSRLAIIDEVAKDHGYLVRDLSALVAMPTETLSAVIKQRIADHQAEAARVQREADAAARAQQQPAASTPAPQPAPTAAPDPQPSVRSGGAARPATRPPDKEIISVLARHYGAPEATIIQWLREMDLRATTQQRAG